MSLENKNIETPEQVMSDAVAKVSAILTQKYPDYLSFGNGSFTISRGSTQVMIIVRPFTDENACIDCVANVVFGANISTDLMRFLLRKNYELHFGSFGLLFDDTITFSHSFSASCLDNGELEITLDSVATIADYYDDIIVDQAGGKRSVDVQTEL
jgi:hypothetical protein